MWKKIRFNFYQKGWVVWNNANATKYLYNEMKKLYNKKNSNINSLIFIILIKVYGFFNATLDTKMKICL